jgi:hypothetical protein
MFRDRSMPGDQQVAVQSDAGDKVLERLLALVPVTATLTWID